VLLSRSLKAAALGFAILAPVVLAGCDRESADKAQPAAAANATAGPIAGAIDRSHQGSQLPEFTFANPAGQQLRLTRLKGQPLLINLWATWCGPCVIEMPQLDQLAKTRQGKLKVLTISQDMTQPEKVAAFFKDRQLTQLEPWLDPENDLGFHYNTGTLPTTIYYGADGRERWRVVGEFDWSGKRAAQLLDEASS